MAGRVGVTRWSTMSEIGIILPSYKRSDRLLSLLANIQEVAQVSTSVHFVVEQSDAETIKTLLDQPCGMIVGDFGSFAKAANEGYRMTDEPFFAMANDDVRFHEGWDVNALARMSDTTHIVGLNDGSGDCKCFTLARRTYIEEHSGVYDKPNTVYHEYVSQCPDTEFAFYAQLRGVWEDCPEALLEHVHWRFGKASPDHENYEKARAHNDADLAIYADRKGQWDPENRTPMATKGGGL